MQANNDKFRFLTGVNIFSTLYTRLPRNKLLVVLTDSIDFSLGEEKIITGLVVIVIILSKDNQICLNKQQINDAVVHLLFNCYFIVDPNIFCQFSGIPIGLIQLLFSPTNCCISLNVSG